MIPSLSLARTAGEILIGVLLTAPIPLFVIPIFSNKFISQAQDYYENKPHLDLLDRIIKRIVNFADVEGSYVRQLITTNIPRRLVFLSPVIYMVAKSFVMVPISLFIMIPSNLAAITCSISLVCVLFV